MKKQEKTTRLQTNRLLTVREAALLTGYEQGAIRGWANTRRIQHVRLGRVIRIPENILQAFIAAHTIPAKAE